MLTLEILKQPVGIKIYINENVCHYYQFLLIKCKQLCNVKWTEAFWVSKMDRLNCEMNKEKKLNQSFTLQIYKNYFPS